MINVLTIGLGDLQKEVTKASKDLQQEIDAELEAACMEYVRLAKSDLSQQGGDRGTLLKSIDYDKKGKFSYVVFARTFYAAFIEFGTKSKFNPYPGTEEYASQFKGEKGSGTIKLIDAIKGWVIRKGIATGKEADKAAFLISRSIYKNGINAKPFFFKQIPVIEQYIKRNVTALLNGI